jgi:large subunit ribosomal protein L9
MKVILNKDLENLGEEGDICDVAPGYARNYLIPNSMVVPYTKQNLAVFEGRRAEIEQRKEQKRKQAMSEKERIESEPLVLMMPAGSGGKLFGSVTSATIAEALEGRGVSVQRKKIDIPDSSIKSVGNYTLRVRLYESEEAELNVSVKPEGGTEAAPEAEAKAKPKPKAEAEAEPKPEAEPEAAEKKAAPETAPEERPAADEEAAVARPDEEAEVQTEEEEGAGPDSVDDEDTQE